MTRKRVMTVKLGEVISPEANWSPPGTKMDWRSVSTGHMKVQIGRQEYSALVDDGAEMNIIRERHTIEAGLKINRDDYGFLVGVSGSTSFCGTASDVLVTVEKVKVRSYFYVLPRVEHEVLLGRAFLCRSESIIINKHDGTMFVILCDPVCDYYEVVKCANTGPYCSRNRLNLESYSFPESKKLRREKELLGEEPNPREFSLTLPDIGQAIDFVSTHAAIDPNVVQALTEIITDTGSTGTMHLVYSQLDTGTKCKYKKVGVKAKPVPILITQEEEVYYREEREWIREMKERGEKGPCRLTKERVESMIIGEEDLLTEQEKGYIIDILREEHLSYAFDDDERGRLDVDKILMIRVHTVPHEPWNVRGPRYPNREDHRKVVAYLDGKIRTKVADYSYGPYASQWFCFIKPNGTLRWIQDLQKLNSVTVRDAEGLPYADLLSESCAGRSIITLIDLYSGYDQFSIYTADRPKMAMHTPRGLIHMCMALQGWTNVVAIVQRYMTRVMQPYCPNITSPYIDDLAIPGCHTKDLVEVLPGIRRFVWEHINDVVKVLKRLKEFNLIASGIKSRHCMKRAVILGFLCDEKGRRPDAKKTNKILEWPTPFKSITDVQSFLGTCGFWRIFIRRFAARVEHLRKLVRKGQKWGWGPKQQAAVEDIKTEFREGGLILGVPFFDDDEKRSFVIETDAGPTALGKVLIQKDAEGQEKPLRFESRTLNAAERNYSHFKKETLRSNIYHLEPLNPRYVAEPGAVVHLDLLVMPPRINGYRYIFDARDNLTGFVDGCAIRERTGSVLAECIEEYYLRYPFIQEIVMDRGDEFRAKEVQTLFKRLGLILAFVLS
ncbi:hypothetical protein CBR_g23132 [Chara braunii]|uniref:Integrase catalytic domain-containing protein n=1 Tax=Chara braunii TaxID=69332 RepID=A0A388L3U4_CHABU|nr:hypothetical protein CBR_g23132 [Chara braunii]|eukprot:GBG76918.1 hypothetical protein CBR_g23132 [Chara braunii]